MFALACIQPLEWDKNACATGVTTRNPRLQGGLDATNKAVRVNNYIKTIIKEVEIIAHACGVDEPRQLTRRHLLIVQASGRSVPFDKVWDKSRYV